MPSMRPLIAPPAAISQRRPRLPDPGDISRPAPPNLIGVNLKHHAVTNPHDMGEVARAGDTTGSPPNLGTIHAALS